ncbi:MAG TPA: phage tail sheath C-terminal domain-containing protein [Thermoanaerobaculia bacterium]|nr:phage tail sheath C-terminal domain-containing protein [Thermoanaerobaculia bacterium]
MRTITGVSTSVAAFIGQFRRGPMDEPVQLFNLGDFERELGGLLATSEASYAIQQFFLNGGSEAWAVRTAKAGTAKTARVDVPAGGTGTALEIHAVSEGAWGNELRASIDHKTADPATFNLTITEAGAGGRTEIFRNLSMTGTDPRFVATVVNDGSKLVWVKASGSALPVQNGTVSGEITAFPNLQDDPLAVNVTIGEGPYTAILAKKPKDLPETRASLESAIRGAHPINPAFAGATVELSGTAGNQLRILAGPGGSSSQVVFSAGDPDPAWKDLKLDTLGAVTGLLSGELTDSLTLTGTPKIEVIIDGGTPQVLELSPGDLQAVADSLQAQLKVADTKKRLGNAGVVNYPEAGGKARLIVVLDSAVVLEFSKNGTDPTATTLKLTPTAGELTEQEGVASGDLASFPSFLASRPSLHVKIGSAVDTDVRLASRPSDLENARNFLEQAIQGDGTVAARKAVRVILNGKRLVVLSGNKTNTVQISSAPLDNQTITDLKLSASLASVSAQQYALTQGNDGAPPNGMALIGDLNGKTGIYALEKVDLFNILCIPRTALVSGAGALSLTEASAVMSAAIQYCEKRRAMFLVDTPDNKNEVQEIKEWLDGANLGYKNAALYFPRVQIADPLNEFRLRSVGASGTIAGLYARTDSSRGVWKAPAGTEATLNNVQELDVTLSNAENGTLNPLAINTLRNFPVYGTVCWGARTLVGADQMASEWKYVPVRRLALFLEESLYRGTQWVVFEPNDEPLWSQIRLNIGAFMNTLFRQGAFQGKSPREAYLVKCDKETTTQTDINSGVVNILVGFAPLKPAEFVIIRIQQLAGQIQT